jgi:hypothetical protein
MALVATATVLSTWLAITAETASSKPNSRQMNASLVEPSLSTWVNSNSKVQYSLYPHPHKQTSHEATYHLRNQERLTCCNTACRSHSASWASGGCCLCCYFCFCEQHYAHQKNGRTSQDFPGHFHSVIITIRARLASPNAVHFLRNEGEMHFQFPILLPLRQKTLVCSTFMKPSEVATKFRSVDVAGQLQEAKF